jgi:hypothetical protein
LREDSTNKDLLRPEGLLESQKSIMKTIPCLWFKNTLNKKFDCKNFVHDAQARSEDCVVQVPVDYS